MPSSDRLSLDENMEIYRLLSENNEVEEINPLMENVLEELYIARDEYYTKINELSMMGLKMKYNGASKIDVFKEDGMSLWNNFIEAAKAFFEKMMRIISGVWKWIIRQYDSLGSSNDAFVKKYNKYLLAIDNVTLPNEIVSKYVLRKFPMEIEPPILYKIQVPDKLGGDNQDGLSDGAMNLKKEEIIRVVSNNRLTTVPDNITEAFKNLFYGDYVTTPEVTFNIKEQLDIIKQGDKIKREYTSTYKAINAELMTIQTLLSSFKVLRIHNSTRLITQYVELCKFNSEVLYAAYTQYCKALVDRAYQARVICIEALNTLNVDHESYLYNNITDGDHKIEFKTLRSAINELSV